MTALFVPALRIMGEHFPECAELSQHHSSAALEKKWIFSLLQGCTCQADLHAVPCKCSYRACHKNSSDTIAALWGLESL